ncbi:NAD(P)H-dependent oxidoreductase [Pseudomonas sp. PCH446]
MYSPGSPAAALEHQESYLIGLLGFLGVIDTRVVRAEGLAVSPEDKDEAINRALQEIATIGA